MDLVYKNEKPIFRMAAALSAVFWLALTVGTFGIVLHTLAIVTGYHFAII